MQFDVILANINKNVLLEQMKFYTSHLSENGKVLLSGFYEDDIEELVAAGENEGLKKVKEMVKNTWALLILSK
jgi:ribosomal protein L11 methyltransferase